MSFLLQWHDGGLCRDPARITTVRSAPPYLKLCRQGAQIPSILVTDVLTTIPCNHGQSNFGGLGYYHRHLWLGALVSHHVDCTKVLDYWCTHPTVREVVHNLQHSWQVLAIVHCTLPEGNKGKPAVLFRASLVYIPAHQAQTNLSDALSYLKHAKGDCVVLVSMPIKPTYSPQPRGNRYFTLLPINSNSGVDHGPLSSFAVATLQVVSREVQGNDMAVCIKLPPCFGSSKCTKYELIMETVLSRGPLWHNTNYVECKNNGKVIVLQNGQPLCQELEVSLCPPWWEAWIHVHWHRASAPADSSGVSPRMGRLSRPGPDCSRDVPTLDRRGWAAGRGEAKRRHPS